MRSKPFVAALVLVFLACGGVIVWQQQTLTHLRAEIGEIREQVSQAEAVRAEDQLLVSRSNTADDGAKVDRTELMRLRAQVARLKQLERENAQVKPPPSRRAAIQEPAVADSAQPVVAAPVEGDGAPPASVNLGVVEFSDGVPTRLDLGAGRQCVATASTLPDGNLQLQFTAVSNATDGSSSSITQTVSVAPGAQLFSSMNGIQIALKPQLKAP